MELLLGRGLHAQVCRTVLWSFLTYCLRMDLPCGVGCLSRHVSFALKSRKIRPGSDSSRESALCCCCQGAMGRARAGPGYSRHCWKQLLVNSRCKWNKAGPALSDWGMYIPPEGVGAVGDLWNIKCLLKQQTIMPVTFELSPRSGTRAAQGGFGSGFGRAFPVGRSQPFSDSLELRTFFHMQFSLLYKAGPVA